MAKNSDSFGGLGPSNEGKYITAVNFFLALKIGNVAVMRYQFFVLVVYVIRGRIPLDRRNRSAPGPLRTIPQTTSHQQQLLLRHSRAQSETRPKARLL